jgi:hypothetical protein
MIRDPIVAEVHQVRERLWEECGGDLDQYVARLKEIAAVEPTRLLTIEARRRERQLALHETSKGR